MDVGPSEFLHRKAEEVEAQRAKALRDADYFTRLAEEANRRAAECVILADQIAKWIAETEGGTVVQPQTQPRRRAGLIEGYMACLSEMPPEFTVADYRNAVESRFPDVNKNTLHGSLTRAKMENRIRALGSGRYAIVRPRTDLGGQISPLLEQEKEATM